MNSTEQSPRPETTKSPRNKAKSAVFGAAILAAGIGGGVGANQLIENRKEAAQAERFEAQNEAAEKVALQFKCGIELVKDQHKPPESDPTDDRTTVIAEIGLEDNPAAIPALERYAQDDSVAWLEPLGVHAFLHPETQKPVEYGEGIPFLEPYAGASTKLDEENHKMYAKFTPKNNYPEGVQASLYVTQDVLTTSDEAARITTGRMYCGELVFSNNEWTSKPTPSDDTDRPKDSVVYSETTTE